MSWVGLATNQIVSDTNLADACTTGVFTAKTTIPSTGRELTATAASTYAYVTTGAAASNQLVKKSNLTSSTSCAITGSNVVNSSVSSATGSAAIVGPKMVRFLCFGGAGAGNTFSARLVIDGTTYNLSCTINQTKTIDIVFSGDGSFPFTLTRVSSNGTSGNNASVNCI